MTESNTGSAKTEITESTTGIPLNQATNATASPINQANIAETSAGFPINEANITDTSTGIPINKATETTPGSANDCSSLVRRRSICKVPGLRRSSRTKRFLYPTASQVAKQDRDKRSRETNTSVNNSQVLEKDKTSTAAEKGVMSCDSELDDGAVCNTRSDNRGEDEMPEAKRLKIYVKGQSCESERGTASVSCTMSSAINGSDKDDDVLFDMDALSQFPVESVLSPPSLNCDSDSLNDNSSLRTTRQEMNVTFTIASKETHRSIEKIDPLTCLEAEDGEICSDGVRNGEEITKNKGNPFYKQKEQDMFEQPVSCSSLETNTSLLRSESNDVGFHNAGGERIEISDKALNDAQVLLEDLDLPMENSATENQVGTSRKPTISVHSSCIEELDMKCRSDHTISREENFSDFEEQQTSAAPAFCGFSTASGKRVCVSEVAMKQARKTLSQIDAELNISSNGEALKSITEMEEPSYRKRNKRKASEKELGAFLDFQDLPHVCTRSDLVSLLPDSLDGMKKHHGNKADDLYLCETGNKQFEVLPGPDCSDMAPYEANARSWVHTNSGGTSETGDNSLQNAGEIETKQRENVNDSLLEDLLNDCKRKRKHSMGRISEGRETMEEPVQEKPKMDESSELKNFRLAVDTREALESRDGSATELRLGGVSSYERTPSMLSFSGFQTAAGKSVSISEAALTKARNTWKQIDEELTLMGTGILPNLDRESANGSHTVPARSVESLGSSKTVGKSNANQIEEQELLDDRNEPLSFLGFRTANGKVVEISEDALQAAKCALRKIDHDFFAKGQSKSLADSPSLSGFNLAFDETENNCEQVAKTAKEDIFKHGMSTPAASFSTFSGFQTAGGKKVTLSKEASKNGRDIAKRLAADSSDHIDEKNEASSLASTVGGFHLADAKNISVSNHASVRGRRAITEIEVANSETEAVKDLNSGLRTAHGQKELCKGSNSSTDNHFVEADKGGTSNDFFGFQTASGKRVEMSEKALQKGVQIMQQIDSSLEKGITKGEQNADLLSAGFCNATGKSPTSTEFLDKESHIIRQIDKSVEQSEGNSGVKTIKFAGFQTAAGKSLKLSEDALRKGAQMMQQIDKSVEQNEGKTGSNNTFLSGFSGFHTAAGRSVKLSRESLDKGAAIMQQIDRSLEQSSGKTSPSTAGISGFCGFQTGSGQSVNLSKESLTKGVAIIQEIDRSLEQNKGKTESHTANRSSFPGFQTASGQSVKLSKESLEKGAAIMQQIDRSLEQCKGKTESSTASASGFSGFQTAAGKGVKLSKESLEKGAAIMQQIGTYLDGSIGKTESSRTSLSGLSGFQTAAGKGVELSKESLEKGAAIMKQIDRSLEQSNGKTESNTAGVSGFTGFQTAGGQKVKLSKESLDKGAAIMQQIDRSLEQSKEITQSSTAGFSGFTGFQTAGGQKVKLSKESLDKGAAIMQQIDRSLDGIQDKSESNTSSFSCFSGFQTAGGQQVKVSKESLDKGAEIMQKIDKSLEVKVDKDQTNTASFSAFSGFQTAGGKTVQISESALAKAKETMAGIESEVRLLSSESGSLGEFQTKAKGKTGASTSEDVSSNTRGQSKSINEGTENGSMLVEKDNGDVKFKGFFTAGGQRVSVSAEALSKARAFLFQTDNNNDFSDSKIDQGSEASLRECAVAGVSIEVKGATTPKPEGSSFVEHDDAVSREIFESSEALLADESFMDVSEIVCDKQERSAAGMRSFNIPQPRGSLLEREKGKSHAGKIRYI